MVYHNRNIQPLKPAAQTSRRGAGVLHLCADLDYGDPARETVTLAVLTQRLGWRATIASAAGSLVTEAERAAVKHIRMPLDKNSLFANWRARVRLEALLQRERPALVHAHGLRSIDIACRLSRLHRLPLVVDLTQPLPDHPQTHRLMTQVAQTSCSVRVPSRAMLQHLISSFRINPALIQRIAPGVDLQSYHAGAISAERLHTLSRLWRLPEQALVVLVPAPLEPDMGQDVMLRALASLKDENLYVIMVGKDKYSPALRQELERHIDRAGLSGKVIMPDQCPDWPAAFWLANVIAAPNIAARGQNIEILAAQAVGRPVIVTSAGANEEMVAKGETAWVVPPGDVGAMARALREASQMTGEQRVILAGNTRYFIEEHFPQNRWFNGMMELYESMMYPVARQSKGDALQRQVA